MKVGVVGAGMMGAEIALVFALGGHHVLLNDLDVARLEHGLSRIKSILDKGVARAVYASETAALALSNISTSKVLDDLAECNWITEAVYESLEAKSSVLRALDGICMPQCILASNTSTIPISTLAGILPESRRPMFVGTHYFSPVSRMRLVEVIPAFDTSPVVFDEVMEVMVALDKHPVRIKDVSGFAVNRMLHAMLAEAVRLVEEGVASPEDLDIACRLGLGHPIGPFALMDAVTSDLCLQVQNILHESYGERFRPPSLLKQRVAAGLNGGRGRRGWLTPEPAGKAH